MPAVTRSSLAPLAVAADIASRTALKCLSFQSVAPRAKHNLSKAPVVRVFRGGSTCHVFLVAAAFVYCALGFSSLFKAGALWKERKFGAFVPFENEVEDLLRSGAGVSVVSVCQDPPSEVLTSAIKSWMRIADEVVVLDWHSKASLLLSSWASAHGRAHVVRVEGETDSMPGRAYNLAVALSVYDTVVFMDCECVLTSRLERILSDWRKGRAQHVGEFLVVGKPGRWEHLRHTVLAVDREAFKAVHGFREGVYGAGPFGADLAIRLRKSGLKEAYVDPDSPEPVVQVGVGFRAVSTQREAEAVRTSVLLRLARERAVDVFNGGTWEHRSVYKTLTWKHRGRFERYPASLELLRGPPDVVRTLGISLTGDVVSEEWRRILHEVYDLPWLLMRNMSASAYEQVFSNVASLSAREMASVISSTGTEDALELVAQVGSPKIRFLVVHVMHGLGNRLRALGSAMAFAEATGRQLIVVWEQDVHCGASFDDLFERDLVVSAGDSAGHLTVVDSFGVPWEQLVTSHIQDHKWDDWDLYNYMYQEGLGAEKDRVIRENSERSIYVKSAYVLASTKKEHSGWDVTNKQLNRLKPRPSVKEFMSGITSDSDIGRMVGVHIRSQALSQETGINAKREYGSDGADVLSFWRKQSQASNFVGKMKELVAEDPSVRFFIASDSSAVVGELKLQFPGKVESLKSDGCDSRASVCMQMALADMMLLGKTKLLLGSPWSSFTEGAQRFGNRNVRIVGIDFGQNKTVDHEGLSPAIAETFSRLISKKKQKGVREH